MSISFQSSTANYAGTATLIFNYYDPTTNSQIAGLVNYISVAT